MKSFIVYFFKVLFGLSLFLIGFQGLINVKSYLIKANFNINYLIEQSNFDFFQILKILQANTKNLVLIHYFFFIIGGFLTIFELKVSKYVILLAVLLNLTFINNVFVSKDENTLLSALQYFSFIGCIFNF